MSTVRRLVGHRSLSAQILAIQTAVLVLTLVAGFLLAVWYQGGQLDRQYEQRALGVAETVASTSSFERAVAAGDPHGVVQTMAEKIWRRYRRQLRGRHELARDPLLPSEPGAHRQARRRRPRAGLLGAVQDRPALGRDADWHARADGARQSADLRARAPARRRGLGGHPGRAGAGLPGERDPFDRGLHVGCSRPRDRPVAAADPEPEAPDPRAGARCDRRALPGARGHAARDPRRRARSRYPQPGAARQRRGKVDAPAAPRLPRSTADRPSSPRAVDRCDHRAPGGARPAHRGRTPSHRRQPDAGPH